MGTVKRNPFLSGACAVLGGLMMTAGAADADVTSDRPAGLVVIPKVVFDSAGVLGSLTGNGSPVDTEIQMTNVSDQEAKLRCFYVNANSHCSNDPERVCSVAADCQGAPGPGGLCFEGWIETDFEITLTPRQPLIWLVSEGLFSLPLADQGQVGSIPGANEDPFMGELKCVQVGPDDAPVDRNDIKAEVSIISYGSQFDARAYNAVGIQAVAGANDGDNTLVLGGEDPEYSGCPNVLILNHFFEDAVEPVSENYVKTHLTLVPCSQNFLLQDVALFNTTVQFLVFNEFEQRFSASRSLRCFKEFELCSLGTGLDRAINDYDADSNSCQRSVFSAFVSGTLTGQTRIRGVDDGSPAHGNGLVGVAEEFYRSGADDLSTVVATDAFNIHQAGERATADFITMP